MTEPKFDLPPKAPPEVVAERDALADEVCRELARTGLPVHRGDLDDSAEKRPGARVHVTPFVDGGVYVNWTTNAELRDTALDLFAQGIDYADPPPVLRHYNSVLQHMRAALSEILASAGFEVTEPDRHGHGSMIQVKGFRP
ncbi:MULTISPECIES: hypothetical protein [Streptomyces]|uniref:Uncharacterized protein n=1 Tax=Streptomyces sviceus (strain ATCC 29083 / DSM 924 / JCM 4929 / NBRC 13980 / NCIMB 11184 / NRRL 5439 / UC 5370) TaxID=463191 RepID=B5HPY1_STRX2|nr:MULTISPECIES: hypothetical protein [Streptomyces]EDY54886.1 conserved hypothetical protein [Streptomyces sviceus ATCC 29083]MYT07828.1 hypothetical protein [Streptomyces sp. SID5470]